MDVGALVKVVIPFYLAGAVVAPGFDVVAGFSIGMGRCAVEEDFFEYETDENGPDAAEEPLGVVDDSVPEGLHHQFAPFKSLYIMPENNAIC